MTQHPELSRRTQVRTLGRQASGVALETVVEADDRECMALARRLGVPAVAQVSCRFRLSGMDAAGRVRADGLLHARLDQICVLTLERFQAVVVEPFALRFVPDDQVSDDPDDPLDLEADDDVPYAGGVIDLGEAAVEQLALALDPYPRMPGAELPEAGDAGSDAVADGAADKPNPFAVLERRRRPDH